MKRLQYCEFRYILYLNAHSSAVQTVDSGIVSDLIKLLYPPYECTYVGYYGLVTDNTITLRILNGLLPYFICRFI